MTTKPLDDGHDDHARGALLALLARYRREGLAGVRAAVADARRDLHPDTAAEDLGDLVVEAVLTLAEATSPAAERRRAWQHFDEGEAAAEAERDTTR